MQCSRIKARAASGAFGRSVSGVGDASGDGIPDLAVGAAPLSDENGADAGSVHVLAGAPHSHRLRTFIGAPGEGLNPSAVGDFFEPGWRHRHRHQQPPDGQVMSGADGATLYTLTGSGSPYTNFGWSVAGGGEVDQDGTPDLVVGDPADTHPARQRVPFLGADRHQALVQGRHVVGVARQPVAMVQDVNGDGVDDVPAGAAGYGSPGRRLSVLGVDGAELLHVQGKNQTTGLATRSRPCPTSMAMAWPSSRSARRTRRSRGATMRAPSTCSPAGLGASLAEVRAGGENLGWFAAACGDVNQDGVPDIVAAAVVANEARVFAREPWRAVPITPTWSRRLAMPYQ
ncbi:MAG: integrin alpha [Planctomycetota bacterium]